MTSTLEASGGGAPADEAAPPQPPAAPRRAVAKPAPAPLEARRWVLDLGASALLMLVAVIGFWPTFESPVVLLAGLGGLILGLGIAALGALRRWGILLVAAGVVVAYFLLGGPLALPHTTIVGVLPSLETLQKLALGVVTSWKSLLTTVPPVAPQDGHLIVPFLLLLVFSTLTASLALRVRPAAWALLPAGATIALQIALGTSEVAAPVLQGILLGVVAIAWVAVREAWAPTRSAVAVASEDQPHEDRRHVIRRVATAAGVLGVAAAVGGVSTLFAPPNEIRYVIRDVIIPPFDIRQFPSPLQDFRIYVDDFADEPLFTATGLPDGARVRLGTMDAYSGVVYNVSDSSSAFTPLRSNMAAGVDGETAEVRVEIGAYRDVWLPDVGQVDAVEFEGGRAEELRRATYYNPSTGTGVVTAGLAEGDAYTFTTVVPSVPDEATLAEDAFAQVEVPQPVAVPERLGELAADAISEAAAKTPFEKVKALQTFLVEGGFFSHGLDEAEFSPSGHGSARLATMTSADQMVGDDEQYAAVMALMAHEVGIPARVVMGFHAEESDGGQLVANGDNLHAWVEVAFADSGWVAFDATPDEDKEPKDQTTQPKTDPQPMPLQPPPPPKEDADEPPLVPDDREAEDDDEPLPGYLGLALAIGGISLGTIALLLAPFVIIGAIKAARRRKRRQAQAPADRMSGGWDELMDRAVDFGRGVPAGGTRYEQSAQLVATLEEPRVATLAVRADAGVFGPGEPTDGEIEAFWTEVDEVVGGMSSRASLWKRLRARLNLRSLTQGSSVATRVRSLREQVSARRKER
ncbi:transglutaminase-like domain-containing protein [Microbacterium marinilacus]|uniref:Transglutaminase-like domain-containing protein n=1 Tax=Microbacterium marinilacus TaxID=415209 RepID=A0ABP7BI26_9MICO|nr:transglutaminase-like domain-containing protein [Microbacterium marinilacus]MBY0689495.1 transglutaminase-like domain-containing protein [Microbacterium marinilacus]